MGDLEKGKWRSRLTQLEILGYLLVFLGLVLGRFEYPEDLIAMLSHPWPFQTLFLLGVVLVVSARFLRPRIDKTGRPGQKMRSRVFDFLLNLEPRPETRFGLFEKSGIALGGKEETIKLGWCQGKVPKDIIGNKVRWDYAYDGELVLTNRRLIVLGNLWGSPVVFPNLELTNIVSVKVADWNKLQLSVILENGRMGDILLEVFEPPEWANAINNQSGK